MFSLPSLFNAPARIERQKKDLVAKLLKTSPEALAAFEKQYAEKVLSEPGEDRFEVNSRQASAQARSIDPNAVPIDINMTEVAALEDRIVDELLADTQTWSFDGVLQTRKNTLLALPANAPAISIKDLSGIPLEVRPQLTGNLLRKDMPGSSYMTILSFYSMFLSGRTPQERATGYHHFRQGLDLLDLDGIVYQIIDTNKNSMSHWLPQLVDACQGQTFFKIPATTIAHVPLPLLQLTHLEYEELTQTTLDIVDKWAMKAFGLNEAKDYFSKTGVYSSKYDFRNAKVSGKKEVRELGEYLVYIHFQANSMAGPLVQPRSIYGVSTTTEWVVREFIPDKENNPCIYKGLPLHTEYRIFVDCDTDQVLGYTPYWEPEMMKNRFDQGNDANSPHQVHDYVIYKMHEDTLMARYEANIEAVVEHVKNILPALNLQGQWSIDIMQNGDDFWLIDMALAENSAFYEVVPPQLRRKIPEQWLPEHISLGESK